jgi:hypothetical protein
MSTTDQMGEFITLEVASEMTARYRNSIQPGEAISYTISKEFVARIIAQDNCHGLRIYIGIKSDGVKNLIINGTDELNNDMYDGLIADGMIICPSDCFADSPLNS